MNNKPLREQLAEHLQSLKAKGTITDENIATVLAHWDSEKSNNLSDEDCLASVIKRFFKPKNKEATASVNYRNVLERSLKSKKSLLSANSIRSILKTFDSNVVHSDPQTLCEKLVNDYSGESFSMAYSAYAENAGTINFLPSSPVSREIESDLARINAENSVNTNSKSRIAKIIREYRVALSKFSNVTLNSPFTRGAIDILSPEEIAEVRGHWASKDKKDIVAMQSFGSFKKTFTMACLELE